VLTLLVVLGHASQPFLGVDSSPNDPAWVRLLDHVSTALVAVRMPAFFVLAGMVIWRGINTDDVGAFVVKRAMRLGVPLAFVLLMINPVEMWLRLRHGELLGRSYVPPLGEALIPGLLDGTAVLHLWFVRALLYTTLLSPLLAGAVARLSREAKIGLALVILFVGSGAQLTSWHLDQSFAAAFGTEWMTPSRLLLAIRFVTIGMIISSDTELLRWLFGRVRGSLSFVLVAALVVFATTSSRSPAVVVLNTLAIAMLPIPCIVLLSAVFQRRSTWRQHFAALDSSGYTIYLLHHIIVVAGAVMLKNWVGNTFMAFALTFGIALTVPLLLDLYVVRRFQMFAFLMNGVLTSSRRRGRSSEYGALSLEPR